MDIEISLATREQLPSIQNFYDVSGYRGSRLSQDEQIVVALAASSQSTPIAQRPILGAVRLCEENGFQMLRGMRIDEQHRRHGLGTAMLKRFAQILDYKVCYCLPFPYLVNFYQQIGFQLISAEMAPAFLQKRLHSYQDQDINVSIMARPTMACLSL